MALIGEQVPGGLWATDGGHQDIEVGLVVLVTALGSSAAPAHDRMMYSHTTCGHCPIDLFHLAIIAIATGFETERALGVQ